MNILYKVYQKPNTEENISKAFRAQQRQRDLTNSLKEVYSNNTLDDKLKVIDDFVNTFLEIKDDFDFLESNYLLVSLFAILEKVEDVYIKKGAISHEDILAIREEINSNYETRFDIVIRKYATYLYNNYLTLTNNEKEEVIDYYKYKSNILTKLEEGLMKCS